MLPCAVGSATKQTVPHPQNFQNQPIISYSVLNMTLFESGDGVDLERLLVDTPNILSTGTKTKQENLQRSVQQTIARLSHISFRGDNREEDYDLFNKHR
ncbi:MAG TPA: hypothetical protein DE314_10135 [Sulfitobacter sp.]|jgi:hypothetical protein|nr:hypothetical protein [Sulfitobacter sp.]